MHNSADFNQVDEKVRQFMTYYQSERFDAELRLPEKSGFHHFRLQYFSKNRIFRRVLEVVDNKEKLKKIILRKYPKNVFFTPVKWLDPVNVRRKRDKNVEDYILSSPLFFDVDKQLLSPPTLESALETTKKLVRYITKEKSRKPNWIVFSGQNGFHLYYWKWDPIVRKHYSAKNRIETFIVERRKIVKELKKNRILVDYKVTIDPWRVLRVPGTLHGETGFIAKAFENLDHFSLDAVKP